MTDTNNSPHVIFLFGAGASVAAGVPDTHDFVDKFIKKTRNVSDQKTIGKIISILNDPARGETIKVDIEILLEALHKLSQRDKELLLRFYKLEKYELESAAPKIPFIEELQKFIRDKAMVKDQRRVQYFDSLLGFIEERKPVHIISMNYDTCIELFCATHKLTYQDGFDVYWNPDKFDEPGDILLYKLYGSVMWYRSDQGAYIKLPIVMQEGSDVELFSGEKAASLMLYPAQKMDYAEPLLELLVKVKHLLDGEQPQIIIVVGYSFRDDHIVRILWDAARKNPLLHIILIDPHAYSIYEKRLKYYDSKNSIKSSLAGKVICLPYVFENVFPKIKDYYRQNLSQGIHNEIQYQKNIRLGAPENWSSCLDAYMRSEHVEKCEEFSRSKRHEEVWYKNNFQRKFGGLQLIINLCIARKEKSGDFIEFLIGGLEFLLIPHLTIEQTDQQINIFFRLPPWSINSNNHIYPLNINLAYEQLFFPKETPSVLREGLQALQEYVNTYLPNGMALIKYQESRKIPPHMRKRPNLGSYVKKEKEALENIFEYMRRAVMECLDPGGIKRSRFPKDVISSQAKLSRL